MGKTLRVHHLAKELGVTSKAIVAKCNAEGVTPPLKNHMAAISIGLAESIREWFSAGADVTTIEVASPVDLEEVKKAAKKRARAASAEEAAAEALEVEAGEVERFAIEGEETPVETLEVESVTVAKSEGQAASTAAGSDESATLVSFAAETGSIAFTEEEEATATREGIAAVEDIKPETAEGEKPVEGEAQAAVLAPPRKESRKPRGPVYVQTPTAQHPAEPVQPAGPKLVPKAAELKGPRIVRIEAPEPVRTPRVRPARPAAFQPMVTGEPMTVERGGRGRERTKKVESTTARARSPRRRATGAETYVERLKEWRDQDVIERKERLASATGHGVKARRTAEKRRSTAVTTTARKIEIEITVPIALKDFCSAIGTPFNVVFTRLTEQTGKLYKITDMLDGETAELVALDLGISLKVTKQLSALETVMSQFERRERANLQPRPPVVAMLGHVDHGKTSLLDAIRNTRVVAAEVGGITQHIGAYQVRRDGWNVTFLDTPGHEAFTAMRARGANLTDVVVLVVAADDGVMPQTVEAINHAKAAGVQIVVALNKIDLPGVDINKIYAQLAEQDLIPTEWGGQTDVVRTSATTGEGVEALIGHLSTLSELMDLKADPSVPAQGTVIEAKLNESRGIGVQVLVQEGTLKVGDVVVCGPGAGRVRNLLDYRGKRVKEAGPGTPVEIAGLDGIPETGERFFVMHSLAEAKKVADEIRLRRREEQLATTRKPQTLEELLSGAGEGEIPELNVIVKADVQGSVDVLKASLGEFPQDKARLRILHAGVGVISEADVELARASRALLIGFYVTVDDGARSLAERYGVELRLYRVIYDVHDDLHKALEGLLEPVRREEVRAKVEVRQVFTITRVGRIAGCFVTDGTVARNHKVRLIRDGRIILEGNAIGSLKRFKDDAREVRAGFECGLKIEGYDDLKPGDVLETYEIVEEAQKL